MIDTGRDTDSPAQMLAGFRENRHRIRAVEILSSCCATCELDTDREFSLDAVPHLPHAHCTNPDGCRCRYIAVPTEAPAAGTEAPVLYPPLRDVIPAPTIPAHLKTPAAAMIVLGAVVIAFGINVISSTSGGRGPAPNPPSQMAPVASRSVAATGPSVPLPTSAPARVLPTRIAERPKRDREMEARAAVDLQQAEAIARQNDAALRARDVAVQQQAYLQNLLSRQSQTASSGRGVGTVVSASASTAAVSN